MASGSIVALPLLPFCFLPISQGGTKKQQMALDMMDEAREEADNPQLGYHAITTQFKENTTAHGIPHVYHANGKCKVTFWTIISLISLAGLIWNGRSLIVKYISFGVSTSVSIESDRSLTFPAVTICNHNPIKKMELSKDAGLIALIQGSFVGRKKRDVADYEILAANRVRRRSSVTGSDTALAANRVKRQTSGSNAVPGKREGQTTNPRFQLLQRISDLVADMSIAEKTSLGYSLDSMVLDCEFNGYDCNMTSDFEQFWDATFGNCYTYNWGQEETSYKPGATHGLAITFNIDQLQYVGDLAEAAGMRVVVHHQSNMPFPSDEGISITPGQLSYVGMKKMEIKRLGKEYGNCYQQVDPSDLTINVYAEIYGVQYTSKACYVTCFQKHVIDECGCGDGSFPLYGLAFGYKNVSACKSSDATQVACEDNIFTKYNEGTLGCNCPEACDQLSYDYSMSSVIWPTDAYLPSVISEYISVPSVRHLFMNDSDDYTTNMGKFVVYFEEFNYQSITESPAYTFGSLISDMGGILGLYLGFSALTILEFFELIGDLMVWGVIACCKKKKDRANTPVEPIMPMMEYYNKGLTGVASLA